MDLEQKAIERLKTASEMSLQHYKQPLVCTYSGGKDSDVMLELFKRSGIPFEVHNSHTTADAPQTVYHIREVFMKLELQGIKCSIDYHRKPDGSTVTMWNLIPRKLMPPTRLVRYCCSELKETFGENRFVATGVRWDESRSRKEWGSFSQPNKRLHSSDEIMLNSDNDIKRKMIEQCMQKNKMVVNPVIDWRNRDIWDFIDQEKINVNPLYSYGYDRVGCIGCPMAGKKRYKEFADFPTYKSSYIAAFCRILEIRKSRGLKCKWKTGEEVFQWWMEDTDINGQYSMEFKGADLIGLKEKGVDGNESNYKISGK